MNCLQNAIISKLGKNEMIEWIVDDLISDSDIWRKKTMKEKIITLYNKCDTVVSCGCISAGVSSLIDYPKCNRFYENFSNEIYEYYNVIGWDKINDIQVSDFIEDEYETKCKIVRCVYENIAYDIRQIISDEFDFG